MLLINQLKFKAVAVFVILALAMLIVMISAETAQAFDNEPPMPPPESIIELVKRDLANHLIWLEHGGVGYKYHTDTRRSFKRAWEGCVFSKPRPPIERPPWMPIIK
ncbi:hypothetical protein M1N64_04935 [Peptococcaceae bacterium]|nr:hypothetical protein [Peptococcaceae bacterium]